MTDTPETARLFALADAAQASGDAAAAARHLEAVLALADHPRALNALGLRALHAGDAARGVELLRRAVRADGEAPPLWYNLATAYRAVADHPAELQALDSALRLDPYMLPALLAKGQLLERLGDKPGAARAYSGLLKASPPQAQLPPATARALQHARDFVAGNAAALAASLGDALAPARAAAADTRRFDRAVAVMTGQSRVFHNEPVGFHFPFLPEIEFFDEALFPWLDAYAAHTPAIRAELEALLDTGGDGFAPYVAYAPGTPVNQWQELNHSARWSALFLSRDGAPQPGNRARCPNTAAALDALPLLDIPGRGPAAFFSLLRPHTRIPPHTGVTNIRTIVHLPLIVPPGCGFRVGGETRAWQPGTAFAFDDTIEHEAWNDSGELRAILICDVWNPCLTEDERELCRALFAATDAQGGGGAGFNDG